MTDEERRIKQAEKNAISFINCYYPNRSWSSRKLIKEVYLKICRDGITI